eukprot:m.90551 g.90551  ORF g.90551 m.90551 type:complete len:117 (+) comp15266_c3_seq1:102-452(+)
MDSGAFNFCCVFTEQKEKDTKPRVFLFPSHTHFIRSFLVCERSSLRVAAITLQALTLSHTDNTATACVLTFACNFPQQQRRRRTTTTTRGVAATSPQLCSAQLSLEQQWLQQENQD